MRFLRAAVNYVFRVLYHRNADIQVGRGTQFDYWRSRSLGGKTLIGSESIIRCRIDFDSPAGVVQIGDRCFIGASHLVCHTGITIEDDAIISWGVTIVDHDSHSVDWDQRQHDVRLWMTGDKDWTGIAVSPVHVGKKTWVGLGATILKGVTIGEGAVVGAQSVVTRDVPPYTVVAGNPARVVKQLTL